MPRESHAARIERVAKTLEQLRRAYPDAHCELNYSTPLELLVATILSAQCSDRQVNLVTEALFRKYRRAADYAAALLAELESDIRRIGLFRNKARHIRSACQSLLQRHGGEVPRTLEELIALDGVGRKTANVVLGNAFGITSGVVVDTHVARLSKRLGWTASESPERIEHDLQRLVPREHWTMLSHWLIWHGRRRCSARSPDCASCEIADLCPARATAPLSSTSSSPA